jgi:hypothetical protein
LQVKIVCGKRDVPGWVDGVGLSIPRMNTPMAIQLTADETQLIFVDYGSNAVRLINIIEARVDTLAGTSSAVGTVDGVGTAASFNGPVAMRFFPASGTIFVLDRLGARVRNMVYGQVRTG